MSKRRAGRGQPPILPPSDSDADCAARHLCILMVTERPGLWPTLNRLTLCDRIDWPGTLRLLEAAEKVERPA
jgi:hypothetical protein